MALLSKKDKKADATYVTLNKDGKAVWEPGLGAEITARRQHKTVKRKPEEAPVSCDLKETLALDPAKRAEWLDKALSAIPKGLAKPQEVFEIVTNKKFPAECPAKLGQKMMQSVKESLMFFTEKQRLTIAKCKLVKEFKSAKKRDDSHSDSERSASGDHRAARHERGRDEHKRHDRHERSRSREAEREKEEPAAENEREESPPGGPSPEERARIEREFAERQREREEKRAEELKKLEAEKKAQMERERKRKAKIGNAFLMGDEDEDEAVPKELLRPPPMEKMREDRLRDESGGMGFGRSQPASSSFAAANPTHTAAISVMGGDNIVSEAQQILQRGAGDFLQLQQQEKQNPRRKRSPSRDRRRKKQRSPSSRSRSPPPPRAKGPERRSRNYDSLRSPTPDGHLRGQMRAARKAKLMAQMLQQGNVPRVA